MDEKMNGMPPMDMAKIMQKKERRVNIIMVVIMSLVMGLLFAFLARHNADEKALDTMPPAPIMFIPERPVLPMRSGLTTNRFPS